MAYCLNIYFAKFSYLFIPKFIFNKYLYGSIYFSSDFSKSLDRPVGRPKLNSTWTTNLLPREREIENHLSLIHCIYIIAKKNNKHMFYICLHH